MEYPKIQDLGLLMDKNITELSVREFYTLLMYSKSNIAIEDFFEQVVTLNIVQDADRLVRLFVDSQYLILPEDYDVPTDECVTSAELYREYKIYCHVRDAEPVRKSYFNALLAKWGAIKIKRSTMYYKNLKRKYPSDFNVSRAKSSSDTSHNGKTEEPETQISASYDLN